MSGKPVRDLPKMAVQVKTDAVVREWLAPLLDGTGCGTEPMSLSRLLECMLFISRSHYAGASEESTVKRICQAKRQRIAYIEQLGREPDQIMLHLSIDQHACEFADMLKRKFKLLLGSRSELATVLFYRAASFCTSPTRMSYLARRLDQVEALQSPFAGIVAPS